MTSGRLATVRLERFRAMFGAPQVGAESTMAWVSRVLLSRAAVDSGEVSVDCCASLCDFKHRVRSTGAEIRANPMIVREIFAAIIWCRRARRESNGRVSSH